MVDKLNAFNEYQVLSRQLTLLRIMLFEIPKKMNPWEIEPYFFLIIQFSFY